MTTFSNDALEIHTVDMGAAPAVVIGGVTDMSSLLNTTLVTPQTGDAYDLVQSVQSQSPEVQFTTEELARALGVVTGLTGICINSDGTHVGVRAFAQKHDQCAHPHDQLPAITLA